jgi:hypothetical protein
MEKRTEELSDSMTGRVRKRIVLGAAISLILILSSCSTVGYNANYDKPIDFTNTIGKDYTIVTHFSKEVRVGFSLGGLVPLEKVDLGRLVSEEVVRYKGDGVVNLRVQDELGTIDWLISIGLWTGGVLIGSALGDAVAPSSNYSYNSGMIADTFALVCGMAYSSRTVKIEGDIVIYK